MQVSIIITVYNQAKYIEKCLLSLKSQTFTDFEIIVIDDGSVDQSKQIITRLKKQITQLKLIEQKHQGLAAARNLGAKKSKGKILVFLDGDMFFEKDFLKMLIKPIKKGQVQGTFSTQEYVANWDNQWARCWNYNWNLPDKRRVDPNRKDQAKEFRAILKKEFLRAGGLDSIGYTDAWSLSAKLGYRPLATQAKYYHYNPDSLKKVFTQAKWASKRKYKLGKLGVLVALLRSNPIFSLVNGLRKAWLKKEPTFIIFKLVYDCATTWGILSSRKKYA